MKEIIHSVLLFIALLSMVAPMGAHAGLVGTTHNWRVEGDACYREEIPAGAESTKWVRWDCVDILGEMSFDGQVLSALHSYHFIMGAGAITKEAYFMIVDYAMTNLMSVSIMGREELMQGIADIAKEAQEIHPVVK